MARGYTSAYRYSRRTVIKNLGGKCVRCGFSDERALRIDHVNGDGYQRRLRGETWQDVHAAVLQGSKEYQLLCANCNEIKKHMEDEFHHREQRRRREG